jgi:hypothetical protein
VPQPLLARSLRCRTEARTEAAITLSERSWEERQVDALVQEIGERLRPICAQMPAGEFAELVEQVARMQRKWQGVEARNFLAESAFRGEASK